MRRAPGPFACGPGMLPRIEQRGGPHLRAALPNPLAPHPVAMMADFRDLTFRRSHRGEDLRAIRLPHSFANRRYPGFRSGVPCGPGSSGAFEGSRTILPFARGVRGVSGEGAGEAGGGDSVALTGSRGASIEATGASIDGA